jgi:hypothetical protein
MGRKWNHLLFGGLIVMTLASCSSTLSSPLNDVGATPRLATSVDKPTAVSPAAVPTIELSPTGSSAQQQMTIPLTHTQSGGTSEPSLTSSMPISIPLEPALQQIVTQAREDLAKRLGVPSDRVTVDVVIGQEFSTDAFYCKTSKDRIASDESPLAVAGYSILLRASARRYEYHASGQTVVLCRPLL